MSAIQILKGAEHWKLFFRQKPGVEKRPKMQSVIADAYAYALRLAFAAANAKRQILNREVRIGRDLNPTLRISGNDKTQSITLQTSY